MKIILFTKKDKPKTKEVIAFLKTNFDEVIVYEGDLGDDFPKSANQTKQDMIISYISPWIIPAFVLENTRLWNINFHPGPPQYPGIGCFNFALYNDEKTYGATCHLMEEKVDTGKILAVSKFPISKTDTVFTLSMKTYESMLSLFLETMDYILQNNNVPTCNKKWTRKPYTRIELENLCRIEPNMSKEECEKRIRSTAYPDKPGAYIELAGYKFEYNPNR